MFVNKERVGSDLDLLWAVSVQFELAAAGKAWGEKGCVRAGEGKSLRLLPFTRWHAPHPTIGFISFPCYSSTSSGPSDMKTELEAEE